MFSICLSLKQDWRRLGTVDRAPSPYVRLNLVPRGGDLLPSPVGTPNPIHQLINLI